MIETKEKEIDGMKVSVSQFPGRFGFKMQAKLARIFGPVIGQLLSGVKTSKSGKPSEADFDLSNVHTSIQTLFKNLNEEQAEELILELLKCTRVIGIEVTRETFDEIFPGKFTTMYKIIFFVLEVNYGSFFGEGGIGKALRNLANLKSPVSHQNSTKA